jgi:hypothetical protein
MSVFAVGGLNSVRMLAFMADNAPENVAEKFSTTPTSLRNVCQGEKES